MQVERVCGLRIRANENDILLRRKHALYAMRFAHSPSNCNEFKRAGKSLGSGSSGKRSIVTAPGNRGSCSGKEDRVSVNLPGPPGINVLRIIGHCCDLRSHTVWAAQLAYGKLNHEAHFGFHQIRKRIT